MKNNFAEKKGVRFALVDVHNREQGEFNNGEFDTLAIPGENIYSTLDINLQQYGEKLMQGKIGSVVAIEPKTGEVLTMVSSPSYDPRLLTGRDRGKNLERSRLIQFFIRCTCVHLLPSIRPEAFTNRYLGS